jgi:hypothetical protein
VPNPSRVFLDNNIWNMFGGSPGPVLLNDVVTASADGRVEIVGSIELFGELMGTARRKPAKYAVMRSAWDDLVGPRVLHAMRERHCIEVCSGGIASDKDRYFPAELFDVDALIDSDVTCVNDEVYEQKQLAHQLHVTLKDEIGRKIASEGRSAATFDPKIIEADLRSMTFGFVQAAQLKFNLPTVDETDCSFERVPSTWLYVATWSLC